VQLTSTNSSIGLIYALKKILYRYYLNYHNPNISRYVTIVNQLQIVY